MVQFSFQEVEWHVKGQYILHDSRIQFERIDESGIFSRNDRSSEPYCYACTILNVRSGIYYFSLHKFSISWLDIFKFIAIRTIYNFVSYVFRDVELNKVDVREHS